MYNIKYIVNMFIALTVVASSLSLITIHDIPNGTLKNEVMQLVAPSKTQALQNINDSPFCIRDTKYVHVDATGMLFVADPKFQYPQTQEFYHRRRRSRRSTSIDRAPMHVDNHNVPIHHSLQGCTKIIWLNVQGGAITGTAWNVNFTTLHAVPYNRPHSTNSTNYPTNFTNTERDAITQIWQRVAGDYAGFDVDVTTEEPPQFNQTTGIVTITSDTDCFGNAMPAQGFGGIAYVNAFNNSFVDYRDYQPAFVYVSSEGGIGEAASHEMGHNLGLTHHGTQSVAGDDYYTCHRSDASNPQLFWCAIMGLPYYADVSQWSKGEYPDANNFQNENQDDLAIIGSKLSYRPDDAGNNLQNAKSILVNTTQFDGIIETTADIDFFKFEFTNQKVVQGSVDVLVHGFIHQVNSNLDRYGVNLNTELKVYNETGALICSDDKPRIQTSSCTFNGDDSTNYYISVQGVGDNSSILGDSTGAVLFTDYGSVGDYRVLPNFTVVDITTTTSTQYTGTTSTSTISTSTISSSTTSTSTISSSTTEPINQTVTESSDKTVIVAVSAGVGGIALLGAVWWGISYCSATPATQYTTLPEFI